MAVPAPGSWDSATESFTWEEWSACREPDQIKSYYYSGYQDLRLETPKLKMAPQWEYAVAYYAASKFDRPVCGCSNVNQFIERWRRDLAYSGQGGGSYALTPEMLGNRLGTTAGAVYAWKQIQRPGVRVVK